ncbi:MAG: HlyD family efflux transporter periplasmic adaptor subunit [Blastocatellia bacterium]|nr:HlyD family efflux transporter periplasmic adaptor subunit [Blastocatellia bacterium]
MRSLIKRHKLALSMLILLIISVLMFASWSRMRLNKTGASSESDKDVKAEREGETLLACPGRVEGASEAINIGAGADGIIAEIRVREGQQVRAGDVLAVIDRQDLNAELGAARAAAESARQSRARLIRGSRDEERQQAEAEVNAIEATAKQAQLRYDRTERLFRQGVIAEDLRDEARKNLEVAQAGLRAAIKHKELVDAPPLPEELERARAEVHAADERVRNVTERLGKTFVRAPISGRVLKTFMKPGETFSTFTPQPILSLADTSSLRIRAEVDERDTGRIRTGQRAMIQSDALEGQKLRGRVTSIGSEMGRKKVRTGDPAEKSDRDVLEVLIDLDEASAALVVGLRVTVRFLR